MVNKMVQTNDNPQIPLKAPSLKKYIRKTFLKDYLKHMPNPKWQSSIPSLKSFFGVFIVIVLLTALSYGLTFLNLNFLKIIFSINHQDILNIHIGIGAVLIGMAFFVANSLVDINSDKGRVLLHRSNFFRLISAEIITLIIFLLFDDKLCILSVITVGSFTIIHLGKTINVLILDYEMEKSKKDMLIDILNNYLSEVFKHDIYKRRGASLLSDIGDRYKESTKGLISFDYWQAYYTEGLTYYNIHKEGFVTDISIKKLNQFILESMNIIEQNNLPKQNNDSAALFIIPKFYEKSDGKLLAVNNEILPKDTIEKLIKLAHNIFETEDKSPITSIKKYLKIRNKKHKNIESAAKYEVTKIKNRCLQAIKNEDENTLRKETELYLEIINNFYTNINSFGGGFSSEQAQKERNAFPFEQLKYTEWIFKDFRQVFIKGVQSSSNEVFQLIVDLPRIFVRNAIVNNDHLVYQEFINYYELIYYYAMKNKIHQDHLKKALNSSIKDLNHIADHFLSYRFRDQLMLEGDLIEYSEYLLLKYQNLIKTSFENDDIDRFRECLKSTAKSFKVLNYSPKKRQNQKEVFNKILLKKEELYFGIYMWIFYKYKNADPECDYSKYNDQLDKYLPHRPNELSVLLLRCLDDNTERFWKWHSWELEDKYNEEGGAVWISTTHNFNYVYLIQMLKLIEDFNESEIMEILLPNNRHFALSIDGDSGLITSIKKILEDERLVSLISDKAKSKIDPLIKRLKKVKEDFDNYELEIIREAPISATKIDQFTKGLIKNFTDSSAIKNVFAYFGRFINNLERNPKNGFGINQFYDKRAFIQDDDLTGFYLDFSEGFDIGEVLTRGENEYVLDILDTSLKHESIDNFDDTIEEKCDINKIIIISVNSANWHILGHKYEHDYSKSHPLREFGGYYIIKDNKIPVFEFYKYNSEEALYILNTEKLGTYYQHNPLNENEEKPLIENLYIDVIELTENSKAMNDILGNNPDWLQDIGDTDQKIKHLKERVIIKAIEKFEYIPDEDMKGFVFKPKQDE